MTKEDTWKAIDEERARQKADQVSQQPAALNQRVLTDEEVALLSCDEGTLEFNIYKYGHKVAYQDWDSGGPGGAGTVSVYK